MTKIWLVRPGSGSRATKCDKNMKIILIKCENHVKVGNHIIIICCSYYFHIIFTFWGPEPGPRPKSGGKGPGPGPARRRFGARAPECENSMKMIWKIYENNVISNFHIIFTFYSYYFHIFIPFWGSGPRSGPQQSYFCNVPGHILFILFSYFCENLVFQPLHTDNLYKSFLMGAWSQQLAKYGLSIGIIYRLPPLPPSSRTAAI